MHKACANNTMVKASMLPFMQKLHDLYAVEAEEYYLRREKYVDEKGLLQLAVQQKKHLEELFGDTAECIITSSLYAGTNLINDSDIDITVLVDYVAPVHHALLKGFKFHGIKNGYYSYGNQVDQVEIEVKLRERNPKSVAIMNLHNRLNNIDLADKKIITYAKKLFYGTPCYTEFKILMYNMYFEGMDGCHMLQV